MRRTNSSSAPFFRFMIFGKTVPGPFRKATPSTTTFKSFLGSTGGRTGSRETFAITSAGGTGGVGVATTGCSRDGVEISGMAIGGAVVFAMVCAPETFGIVGDATGLLCGDRGLGATGTLVGRAGACC